jgi:hypothetical protein
MRFHKVFIAIPFMFLLVASFGQADSTKINYSEESIDSSDYYMKRKYKYLDLNFKEEKQLFKITAQLPVNNAVILNFTYERKIIPTISLIGDFRVGAQYNFFHGKDNYYSSFSNAINIGTRYYYNLNKRIKNKLGGNNFHANYFTFKLLNVYSYYYNEYHSSGDVTYYPLNQRLNFKPYLSLGWGIQRKLSKNTIIDLEFLFLSYNPFYKNTINIYENIYIGFAFGK